jgi:ferric-dicitrate binding protein FerR (iron transport regulator)
MQGSERANEHRAASPQLPALSSAFERDRQEFERYRNDREKAERRSVVRGLILLALFVLLGSMVRAGLDRVFVHGWWRP